MAVNTIYNDIIFSEGTLNAVHIKRHIKVDLGSYLGAQLKSLRDVKSQMVISAKMHQCNAIMNFKYGQKSKWLAIDNVTFWGEGDLVQLEPVMYNELMENILKRSG